jgi:hypothetical protein
MFFLGSCDFEEISSKYFCPISFQLKGTWQRGGFSGVFAEIGSA